jgi:hypothetical protein
MFSKRVRISDTPCASLSDKVKTLNGKSSKKLQETIKALDEALKAAEESGKEE